MVLPLITYSSRVVAPFAGAWIEIESIIKIMQRIMSLPSRERGLKSSYPVFSPQRYRRSLRGSVD